MAALQIVSILMDGSASSFHFSMFIQPTAALVQMFSYFILNAFCRRASESRSPTRRAETAARSTLRNSDLP